MRNICKIEECEKLVWGHMLCSIHYQRWRKYGDTDALLRPYYPRTHKFNRKCSIKGCNRPHGSHGFCKMHAERVRRGVTNMHPSMLRRPNGAGNINSSGHKSIEVNGKSVYEHRHVMEKHLGRKLLSSEHIHHIDRNKLNNDINNLKIVTAQEHAQLHYFETNILPALNLIEELTYGL